MAQEWYLMNTNHDTVSGFESDDFMNCAQDGFMEALQSAIGSDIEICNYDLSVRKKHRAIVQGNVHDTKLKTINRQILVPIGTCKAGQYVFYENRYWLLVGLVDNNKIYEKAVMVLCNYLLSWKDSNGKIHQRWANATSGSQYNTGETGDQYAAIRNDQLFICMSDDDDTLQIPHRQRFVIDMRCKLYEKSFASDVTVDTSKPLITYIITRTNNVLYNYQDSGHAEYMASQEEQHDNDGYYVVDGKGYWLCDIPDDNDNQMNILSCEIVCDEPVIYNGLEPNIFMAKFYDAEGKEVWVSPQWEINCDFTESLSIEYVDNSIRISANDEKLLNKSFELSLRAFDYDPTTLTVTIKGYF